MRRWIGRTPVSIGVVVVVVLTTAVTGSFPAGPSIATRQLFGIDPDAVARGQLLPGLVTAVLLPNSAVELVLVVLVALFVMGRAERLLGSARTLIVYWTTAVLGTFLGMALQEIGLIARRLGAAPPPGLLDLHPFTPIAGVVMAASAFTGPLWRRRIRLLGFGAMLVVLLYSGHPGDLYRIGAALVGLVAGVLFTRRRPSLAFRRSSHHEARSLVAALVGITAVGPFVALTPNGHGVLRPLGQLVRSTTPAGRGADAWCHTLHSAIACRRELAAIRLPGPGEVLLTVLPFVVLGVAALGLWRGRRVAAIAAVVVELFFAVLAAVYFDLLPLLGTPAVPGALDAVSTVQGVFGVAVPLVVAGAVVASRRHFAVRSGVAARRALQLGGLAVLGVAAAYTGLAFAVRDQFSPVPDLGDLVWDLPERLVPLGFLRLRRADFVPVGPAAHQLWQWAGPAVWTIAVVTLIVCVATVRAGVLPGDAIRMRALLRRGSRGPVAAMALWSGNRYWFSADGRHGLAYRVIGTVALAVGEPAGPQEGVAAAANDFAVACDDQGLTPVFYTVSPAFAARLGQGRRWASVVIGEDTVLQPATFAMTGKRWADVRSSFNRAEREGVRAEWTDWARCTLPRRGQIEAISEEWVADRALPEMGFTLGGLDELRVEDTRLMLAVGPEDRVEAVTSWLPTYRDGVLVGLTLDFMRRRPGGMNGVMEFLIASVALDAQRQGLEFVSLSASPLAVSESGEPGQLDHVLATLSRLLEPAYGFKSLAAFKDKFQPRVAPLVMAYPDAVSLPAIGYALLRAYLPDLSARQMLTLVGVQRLRRDRHTPAARATSTRAIARIRSR